MAASAEMAGFSPCTAVAASMYYLKDLFLFIYFFPPLLAPRLVAIIPQGMHSVQQIAGAPEARKTNALTGGERQKGPVIETKRGRHSCLKIKKKF